MKAQTSSLALDRLLKPAEAAQYLGLKLSTIYGQVSRRQLPFVKIGRSLRFRRVDLEKLVEAGLRPLNSAKLDR